MVRTTIADSRAHAGQLVAGHILDAVAAKAGAPFLLGCPAGRTPVTTYAALRPLADARGVDLSHLQIVMLDEYVVDGELCELAPPPITQRVQFGSDVVAERTLHLGLHNIELEVSDADCTDLAALVVEVITPGQADES